MSSKSKQQLKLDNQTNFPNNNNGFITPDKLRNFHVDIIDSFLTQDGLDTLSTELQTEASERILADQSLSTAILQSGGGGEAISQEISNRISGDQSLSTSISIEKSQRVSSDLSLTTLLSSDYIPYTGANKDVNLGNHTLAVDGIKLDTTTPYVVQNPGEIGWNSVEGTVDLRLLNNTTLQLGQEIHTYGRAVGNILNGDPVQFAGAQGDHILIKTANAVEIEQNPYLLIGIATQNIINGQFGYVTYFGKVNGIFTEDWVSKDEIYFDPILNGLTNQKPNVPNRIIKVGYLIKAQTGQAENGILKVKISYGTRLTDLDDVNGTTPQKGTFPIFQDEGYFDFSTNINDYALVSSLSIETSQRISADTSLTSRISAEEVTRSTGLSTEMSQRISTDVSLTSELSLTTAIAKGAQQALSFQNYGLMVSYLNNLEEPLNEQTHVGQSIYIRTLDVPDIWISGNDFPIIIPAPYNFVSDEQLIADVEAGGGMLQIGFYKISFLETQKVDLSGYATTTALSTAISTEASDRISTDISLSTALSTEISERISADLSLSTAIENIPVGGEEVEITKEFVLGNDSDAGDLMMLNTEDGKVYSSQLYPDKVYTSSGILTYDVSSIKYDNDNTILSQFSPDGSKVAVLHIESSTNIKLTVGTVNTDLTITWGTPEFIESGSSYGSSNPISVNFLPNNNNKIVVGYINTSNTITLKVVTLSGTTISNIGVSNVITNTTNGFGKLVFNPFENNKFLLYSATTGVSKLNYIQINNDDSLTILIYKDLSTVIKYARLNMTNNVLFDPFVKNRFIVSFFEDGTTYQHKFYVGLVNTNDFNIVENTGTKTYDPSYFDFDPFNKNKILYSYNEDNYLRLRIGTIDEGGTISWGQDNSIITNYEWTYSKSYFSKTVKNQIISFVRDGSRANLKLVISSVSDDVITYVSDHLITSDVTNLNIHLTQNKKRPNIVILPYGRTGDTAGAGYINVEQLPYSNITNFDYLSTIGVLVESGLINDTKKVRLLGGIDYNKSGLIVGNTYYVQDDGSVSDVSSPYEYGESLSTTTIKTISNIEYNLQFNINNLSVKVDYMNESINASLSNTITIVNNTIENIPSGYEYVGYGYPDTWSDDKINYTNDRFIPIYNSSFLYNNGGNIFLKIDNNTTVYDNQIIASRYVKKIMVFGKFVYIWTISNSNNENFNITGQETNDCYLLNMSSKGMTSLGANEITFFNYTDKLIYTKTLAGVHTIYDLKTQTPTTYTPGAGTIMFPKSETHCYIMSGTTIGYYALSDLTTAIWSQTMPNNTYEVAMNATENQWDFSPEWDSIIGRWGVVPQIYSITTNLPPLYLGFYSSNIQLSKNEFSLRGSSNVFKLFDMKTWNYIATIPSTSINAWEVISSEDGLFVKKDNIPTKIYL